MRNEALAEVFVEYLRSWLGRWYIWGGDDPSGFDCSGYMVEGLRATGRIGRNEDLSADGLWQRFPRTDRPRRGCLVLFGGPNGATHVEAVYELVEDPVGSGQVLVLTIGASGGGSATKTAADAARQNAYIKVRPLHGPGARTDVLGFVDPFAGE